MVVLKNVLVATDFSEPSGVALAYGRELARTFGAKLHVLHVTESVMSTAGLELYGASIPDLQASIEDAAVRQMKTIVSDEDRAQLSAATIVRTWATPAPAIVAYAEEADIDLIVIGTHGRGGLSHFLMGSVAERVVRLAPCPVLTVRHPEREFVEPSQFRDVVAIAG
jgi:nucleotide-binding universal stress UspA family protein